MLTAVRPTLPVPERRRFLFQLAAVIVPLGIALTIMPAPGAVDAGTGPKLFLLARMAIVVAICTWFLRSGGERWADVGLRAPPRAWVTPLAAVGGLLAILVTAGVVLPALGVRPVVASGLPIRGDLAEYLYWVLPVSWGSAAFGEELVFRGFLLDRIQKLAGAPGTPATLVAIVVQAAVFGSLHAYQGLGGVLLTGTIGLLLGGVWLVGGRNLWACIIIHGLIDATTITRAYTAGR